MKNLFYGLAILIMSLYLAYFFYSIYNHAANWNFSIAFLGGAASTTIVFLMIYIVIQKEEKP